MKEELCRNQCGFWVTRHDPYCPWCGINFPIMPHPLFLKRMGIKIIFLLLIFSGLVYWKGWTFGFFVTIAAAAFSLSLSVKLWNMWDLRGAGGKRFFEKVNRSVAEGLSSLHQASSSLSESQREIETLYHQSWSMGELSRDANEINAILDNLAHGAPETDSRVIVLGERIQSGRGRFPGLFIDEWNELERFQSRLLSAVQNSGSGAEELSALKGDWEAFRGKNNLSLDRAESFLNEADAQGTGG